jgi:hypothetical protein
MFQMDGFFGLVLLALWLYGLFDVITTDSVAVRNLPKLVWLVLVVLLGPLGAIAWLALGRPHGDAPRAAPPSRAPRPQGNSRQARPRLSSRGKPPDDGSDFLARIEARDRLLKQWEQEDEVRRKLDQAAPAGEVSGAAGEPGSRGPGSGETSPVDHHESSKPPGQ